MNYHKHYGLLIKKGLDRVILEGYTENHHIKPRCMGGCDKSVNKVKLTAREHYMAHWFLVKMYPKHHGLSCALNIMTNTMKEQRQLNLSARDYKQVRILYSNTMSEIMVEHFKDPENRKKQSENTTNYFKDPENRKKQSEKRKEHFKDPENRKKQSENTTNYFKDPENRKKASERRKEYITTENGKIQIEEYKKTMNVYWSDEENRKKQSENTTNYFKDPENRKKQSENTTEYFKNPENRKKSSEKTKAHFKNPENRKKMSIAKSKNPFTIDGKYFLNTIVASKKLGVVHSTIWNRLKSPKFPNYKYI